MKIPLVHSYLDALLCSILILGISLKINRYKFGVNYCLPLLHALTVVVLLGLLFELILPQLLPNVHSDINDMIAYTIGAGIFIVAVNRKKKQ